MIAKDYITEDYVSFEIALLLKDKGFSELTTKAYPYFEGKDYKYDISCPTLQMAMKWLLEVHNINIDIVSVWNKVRWEYQIIIITPQTAVKPYIHKTIYIKREQACETAIKYCLENLI